MSSDTRLIKSAKLSVHWVIAMTIGAVLLMVVEGPTYAEEQEPAKEESSIFQRFALRRDPPKFFQTMIEVPVSLRPQTDPEAETTYNLGFNWVSGFRPLNRFYMTRSFGLAAMEWQPTDSAVEKVKVKTVDLSFQLNHRSTEWMVTTFGLGIGMMDGLIYFNDERVFDPRLEPFIPVHFGMALRMGETWQVGLKYSQFSFFRSRPLISLGRIMLGIGYNY